ncbi:FAD-dependent oxidoreductase [Shigella flexneri]
MPPPDCAGSRPARRAGLTINRGVCVDSYLQTRNADIYALGDCAEINGQVLPFCSRFNLARWCWQKIFSAEGAAKTTGDAGEDRRGMTAASVRRDPASGFTLAD